MRDYVVSPKADEDLLEIWRYQNQRRQECLYY
jgi:hypothetical protein